jgi:hypothetical protein
MGQEEISTLKRCQNVSRSLSFRDLKQSVEDCRLENETDMTEQHDDDILDDQSKGTRMSHKQVYLTRLCLVKVCQLE